MSSRLNSSECERAINRQANQLSRTTRAWLLSNKKGKRECEARTKKAHQADIQETWHRRKDDQRRSSARVKCLVHSFFLPSLSFIYRGGAGRWANSFWLKKRNDFSRSDSRHSFFNSKRLTGCAIFGAFVIFEWRKKGEKDRKLRRRWRRVIGQEKENTATPPAVRERGRPFLLSASLF